MKNQFIQNTGRRYTAKEKVDLVLRQITGAATLKQIKDEIGVDAATLISWKKRFFKNAHHIFEPINSESKQQSEKDKIICRQEKENQLLKKLLEHYRKTRDNQYLELPNSS